MRYHLVNLAIDGFKSGYMHAVRRYWWQSGQFGRIYIHGLQTIWSHLAKGRHASMNGEGGIKEGKLTNASSLWGNYNSIERRKNGAERSSEFRMIERAGWWIATIRSNERTETLIYSWKLRRVHTSTYAQARLSSFTSSMTRLTLFTT